MGWCTERACCQTAQAFMVACLTVVACSAAGTSRFPKGRTPGPLVHTATTSKINHCKTKEANLACIDSSALGRVCLSTSQP